MGDYTKLLIYLAEKGAIYRQIDLTTTSISKDTGDSQQTISRKLIELEKKDFIERFPTPRAVRIALKEDGRERLKRLYLRLGNLFSEKSKAITGTVESGLGEGSYYLSLRPYNEQFRKKIGFIPYKGTLNLRINPDEFAQFISGEEKILIDGFATPTRSFGSIEAYRISLKGIDGAIIIPERTSHRKDIIEVISGFHLRKKLNLSDGDTISVGLPIQKRR